LGRTVSRIADDSIPANRQPMTLKSSNIVRKLRQFDLFQETTMGNPAGVRAKKREKRRKKEENRLAKKATATKSAKK
jgi:hypothetical protein